MSSLLVHLHIPKTGGTTLYHALIARIPEDRFHLAAPPDALPAELADLDLVSGHLTWKALERFPKRPAVLTVLRDPVTWALSLIGYYRANVQMGIFNPATQRLADEAASRSLDAVLHDEDSPLRSAIGHTMVDYLAGIEREADRDGRTMADMIATANRNLASCLWVGTTETLDRDLQTLAHVLRWPPFGVPERYLVNRRRQDFESLSPAARRSLWRLTEPDRELYERARTLADHRHDELGLHL